MYCAETGLTYRVWLTPSEVAQLDGAKVRGTLQVASAQRLPLVVLLADVDVSCEDPRSMVNIQKHPGEVTIRLPRVDYARLRATGQVSAVTGNLEIVHAYDVSRYGSPDEALRRLG